MTERKRNLDPALSMRVDAALASQRQELILELRRQGRIDDKEFVALYASTTRPDIIIEEREAFEQLSPAVDDQSPSGRLIHLIEKLRSSERVTSFE